MAESLLVSQDELLFLCDFSCLFWNGIIFDLKSSFEAHKSIEILLSFLFSGSLNVTTFISFFQCSVSRQFPLRFFFCFFNRLLQLWSHICFHFSPFPLFLYLLLKFITGVDRKSNIVFVYTIHERERKICLKSNLSLPVRSS